MKIRDVTISDILQKKFWRLRTEDANDILNSSIEEVTGISSEDIILHPGVLVEKGVAVHPVLVSKYYEDGGEVGEYFVHLNGSWRLMDSSTTFSAEIENTYLGFISTLDIHEYQSGSFDNRKASYERFNFYSKQIGLGSPQDFPVVVNKLPKRTLELSEKDQFALLRQSLIAARTHHGASEVSKGNKKVTEASSLVELIKSTDSGRKLLKTLLDDPEPYIQATMMYQLRDIYGRDCLKMIKKKSKEDSLEGVGARMNLKDPRFMATIHG